MKEEYLLYDRLSQYSFRELRESKGMVYTEELSKKEIMERFYALSDHLDKTPRRTRRVEKLSDILLARWEPFHMVNTSIKGLI